ANGGRGRDRGRGVAGWYASKCGAPDERHIGKRVLVAADIGASTADQVLGNGGEQTRQCHSEKHKAEAGGKSSEHALSRACQLRRAYRSQEQQDEAAGKQEPP